MMGISKIFFEERRRGLNLFMIVAFTFVLVFSVFLPLFSSVSEAGSTESGESTLQDIEEEPEIHGWVADIKEVSPEGIWHSDVLEGDYDKGPFHTDTTTIHLNLTGRGERTEALEPFDWVFSIDSSGSMDWTDPDDIRLDGAVHFVDRVEEDFEEHADKARGATIDFDSTIVEGERGGTHEMTDDYDFMREKIRLIGNTGGTAFEPPMNRALQKFRTQGDPGRPWFHIFLTDGVAFDSNYWDPIAEHANEDITLFVIGFDPVGDYVDRPQLKKMACRSTSSTPIFSLGSEYQQYLELGSVADELEEAFEDQGYEIYHDAEIWQREEQRTGYSQIGDNVWWITYEYNEEFYLDYMIEEIGGELRVREGGHYNFIDRAEDVTPLYDTIYLTITDPLETAVESPPEEDDMMIKEVLPPYLEYVEDSIKIETSSQELDVELSVDDDGEETILSFDPIRDGERKLNIDDEIRISYEVRSTEYGHDLPLTAYDQDGMPRSMIEFYNITTGEIDRIYTPGPGLDVHGIPEPVLGASRWQAEAGTSVVFSNRTSSELSSWPGDCEIVEYEWDFGDGSSYSESISDPGFDGEAKPHIYSSTGRFDVTLTATTYCNISASTTKTMTIMQVAIPPPQPPPPPLLPPPPGVGIVNPVPTPVQVGVANPMAQPTPLGVGQPVATPQVTMQPVATSQPVGMPTTTAIFAGFMPVAAQKNPAEKIKMSVKNLNPGR